MKKFVSNTAIAAVAAGAAASVGANAALAADILEGVTEPDWFLSLEGGVIFADPATDKVGIIGDEVFSGIGFTERNDLDTDFGYRGAAKFGKKFDDNLDWRLGVAYSNFRKNSSTLSVSGSGFGGSGSGNFEQHNDLSYLTGDLELGYNMRPSDRFDLRVFGGLRVLSSKDTEDKFGEIGFSGSGLAFDGSTTSEFLGVGPRLGVDFSGRLSDDSMLGFSGTLAVAVIFGELKQSNDFAATISGSGVPISGISDTHTNETVFNLEAAFGTDFHLTDKAVLTLGYRGELVDRFSDKAGDSSTGNSFLSHGPFVRLI
jgi:hypothetical protein